ncbi:hypothetical protein GCM10010193_20230 [Kitasatospora atroaurantiaca]|uniref:Uncharacterized protein n=1 Tax=Kitasatospora atroaurantiaca TaxID=285545 RepID=A0A561EVE5_9ACTN|nr:hypothetical protein [Kitasatospora atroaurantiaca]TWE19582.1 hypothetical protein FB465_4700 [Kitasatospora atroaurantiaca]
MIIETTHRRPHRTLDVERDWRFAELVVRTRIEPDLEARYAIDPTSVLAEFGLHLAPGAAVPAVRPHQETGLVIERLDEAALSGVAMFTFCYDGV